jgi:cephalosporin hydroxylase
MINNLIEIGSKYGTDKVSHGFCDLYDKKLNELKESTKNVLEIGVFFGASILMWRDYFPNATIYGFDTFEGLQGNGSRFPDADKFFKDWTNNMELQNRIKLYKFDQGKESDLIEFVKLMKNEGIEFDIIIDDGSHLMLDQQMTLKHLFQLVKKDGYFIIEDVHSSIYPDGYDVYPDFSNTTLKMLEDYLSTNALKSVYTDLKEVNNEVESLEIFTTSGYQSMTCLIKKKN